MLRRLAVAWGVGLGAAVVLGGSGLLRDAVAATGSLPVQYQAYSAAGGPDPYASSDPQDIHVDGYGGQPVITGYVRLDLQSLPAGASIDGLTLSLTPNSSQTDNVAPSLASIEACMLTQPLTGNGYQATPPSYDCALLHAIGEVQANGDWHFELAPLAQYWAKNQNTGLALVAYPPPNAASVGVDPSAWAVGFDHSKTAAAVEYSGGTSATVTGPAGTAPAPTTSATPAALQPSPVAAPPGGGIQASTIAPAAGAGVVVPAPSAPAAPAAPPPSASSAPAVAAAVTASTPSLAVVTSSPHASQQWVWLTVALGGAALLMLLGGAAQHVLRGGRFNLGAVGRALSDSRSQLATPIATLALAAVFALGFSGQLVSSVSGTSPSGGGGGPGATAPGGTALSTPGAGNGGPAGAPGTVAPGQTGVPGSVAPGAVGAPGTIAPGSTAAPGASGSAGGGAAAANGNTNGGANGPGVSATAVRIGFVYTSDSGAPNSALGFHVPNPGDTQAQEQALIDYVNKHGGIGGRQIDPVFLAYSNQKAETDPNVGTELCTSFTEDYHVFAVVGGGGPPDDADANACYAQHGTINLDSSYSGASLSALRSWSPYSWMPLATALDREMPWEIAGLQNRGFFSSTPGYKLGIVGADDAINHDIYNRVTAPALRAAGVSSLDPQWVPHDTLSDTANTMKQAVIHMQADNVTHVIFQGGAVDGGGSYAILFMVNAESQHFNPRYGLSSEDSPAALVGNIPQDQFQDAKGEPALAVGTAPLDDTDDQHYAPWPSSPAEKTCASVEAGGGQTFSSRLAAIAALGSCTAVFDLQQGAQGLTTLNAQSWGNHLMQMGSGVYNAWMYRPYVGPDHWDAAGGYRLLHAVQNCEGSNACFEYDNANVYGG